MQGSAVTVSGVGSGATVSAGGVVTGWAPVTTDDTVGGPGSVNPLTNADGSPAVLPGWPETRAMGVAGVPGVLADSGGGGLAVLETRAVHNRGATRRVPLAMASVSGADVELVRRALVATRGGAVPTRYWHPGLFGFGAAPAVAECPRWRIVPGPIVITRTRDGATASVDGLVLERM